MSGGADDDGKRPPRPFHRRTHALRRCRDHRRVAHGVHDAERWRWCSARVALKVNVGTVRTGGDDAERNECIGLMSRTHDKNWSVHPVKRHLAGGVLHARL